MPDHTARPLAVDQRVEYGALFSGRCAEPLDRRRAFRPNEEIEAVHWWDLHEALPGCLNPLDAWLTRIPPPL
ncbi:hypothetical protein AB0E64_14145 [Streptomyces caelestis]|uniref:Uncharacterized protein n=1 Tax=Streptomyces caelestis TaxID=36816 RepID=A0A7W9HA08_9ACTN|nr:hypothetical protein [Streptomyces caelestis]MBB5798083.1 hypothetical protein [Streptomyces caelestis]GGW66071.1 hypothetical protein GCM10010320_54260 [Streptomyces caelestis]